MDHMLLEDVAREVWTRALLKSATLHIFSLPGDAHYQVMLRRAQGDLTVYSALHMAKMPTARTQIALLDNVIAELLVLLPKYTVSDALVAGESRRQPGHRVLYTWAGRGWGIEFSPDLLYGRLVP